MSVGWQFCVVIIFIKVMIDLYTTPLPVFIIALILSILFESTPIIFK
jgi:hypothetical protein